MDNKIVSTTYVPLQPPYQIIKYGKEVGMQIGTLITVSQVKAAKERPSGVETHSYPVVTYGNKDSAPKDQHLFGKVFMEGVVWNRVELKEVSTICLTDSHLKWQEFIDYLWEDIARTSYRAEPQIDTLGDLLDLGVDIEPIPPTKHILHIQTYCGDESAIMLRTAREDILALNVNYGTFIERMSHDLLSQLWKYEMILILRGKYKRFEIEFTTDEEILQPIIDDLNEHTKRRVCITPNGGVGPISEEK